MKAYLNDNDLSLLAVCAIRFCMSRMTDMTKIVTKLAKEYIHEYTDNCILIMWQDCMRQKDTGRYGDPVLDKPFWIEWTEIVNAEKARRGL